MRPAPNNTNKTSKRRQTGFSLIEIAIVIGTITLISALVIPSLFGKKNRTELDSTTKKVAALLREAQSRSINQEDNTIWGVHFENSGTSPFYALFKTSYSDANTVTRGALPSFINYSAASVPSGGSLDITFAKLSGTPSAPASITLELRTGKQSGTSEGVSRSASGKIFFDDFNRPNL